MTATDDAPLLAEEVHAYYARGAEDGRLRSGADRLEFWRTQDVLRRLLPAAPARVLDVGGGSGVHAEWLVADGHHVRLVDPVALHVEQASKLPGVEAVLGDARELDAADGSADVVLLLGPLYHLTECADRVRALAEARRVVRPGGLVVAATINRFAALHDTVNRGWYLDDPGRRPQVDGASTDGRLLVTGDRPTFTTAYFHQPHQVPDEFEAAGLRTTGQYGVEGTVWLMGAVNDWLDDPERRATVLDVLRRTESEPSLLGASGHLLTAGRRS
ncbi:SAM-dependent methyltransferase [Kitasatospora gansuensis]|uniref:SAM-dependent methyltransferase n=1 Tax=Kitasatospora gansuensis TaxID=258050 RepID=A0A7W7SI31_9ACTN|nr:class I SAM-dependent methyltransferase [Kitasatospora gansuensis]MBB4950273.1 SAM-dependent methyltransferase [Kitasatospora gansuensis]